MTAEEDAQNGYIKVKKNEGDIEEPLQAYGWGHRHIQTMLVFLIVTVSYIMRANVSVAIIAMTDKSTNMTNVEIYDWDKKTQDFILSSFFWGYMAMQIPSGQLAQRFGAKTLLVNALVVNGLGSILFSHIVHWGGWQAGCACRAIQGLTQSCLMPSVQIFLSKWAPLSERSRLGNVVMSGGSFGTIVSMPAVGFLSGRFGWPVSFQAVGAISLAMGMLFFWFGSNRPSQHQKISLEERLYIETSLGQKGGHKVLKTPWKSIFTSIPFLALLVAQTGCNWGYLTMFLETPSYLSLVLGVSSEMSGVYSALPYIAMFLSGFVLSFISDFIINKKIVSISVARKGSNTFACLCLGFGIILMTFVPKDNLALALFILIVSTGSCSGFICGIMLAHVDLAPNFAGTLMGITNGIANAIGILAPISVGLILTNPNDVVQWRFAFIMLCVIMNVSNLLFVIFGTSVTQPWNEPEKEINDVELQPRESENVCAKQEEK